MTLFAKTSVVLLENYLISGDIQGNLFVYNFQISFTNFKERTDFFILPIKKLILNGYYITSLQLTQNYLLIGTYQNQILVFNKNEILILINSEENEILSKKLFSIEFFHQSPFFITTDEKFIIFQRNNEQIYQFEIQTHYELSLINCKEISSFDYQNERIVCLTSDQNILIKEINKNLPQISICLGIHDKVLLHQVLFNDNFSLILIGENLIYLYGLLEQKIRIKTSLPSHILKCYKIEEEFILTLQNSSIANLNKNLDFLTDLESSNSQTLFFQNFEFEKNKFLISTGTNGIVDMYEEKVLKLYFKQFQINYY